MDLASLCRVCLGRSGLYSDIYSRNNHNKSFLYQTINDVCQLGISLDDELPRFICAECHLKICEFELFKEHSQKQKAVLAEMVCRLGQRDGCGWRSHEEPTDEKKESSFRIVKTETCHNANFLEEDGDNNLSSNACDVREEEHQFESRFPAELVDEEKEPSVQIAETATCYEKNFLEEDEDSSVRSNAYDLQEEEEQPESTAHGDSMQGTGYLTLATSNNKEKRHRYSYRQLKIPTDPRESHTLDCPRRVEPHVSTRPPSCTLPETATSEVQRSSIRVKIFPVHEGHWGTLASTAGEDCGSSRRQAHVHGMVSRSSHDPMRSWHTREDSFSPTMQQQVAAQNISSSTADHRERSGTLPSRIDTIHSVRPPSEEVIPPLFPSYRPLAEQHMMQGDTNRMSFTGRLREANVSHGSMGCMTSMCPLDRQCVAQHSALTLRRQVAGSNAAHMKTIEMRRQLDRTFPQQVNMGTLRQGTIEERIAPHVSLGSSGQLDVGGYVPSVSFIPAPSKSFHCELCGRQFARYDNLRVHMRVHSGERPYSCELCGKAFSHLNSLKTHRRLHTGEKPFVCKTCAKAFTHKGNLIAHEKSHSVIRAYACKVCGKKFKTPRVFRMHLKTHQLMPLPTPDLSGN